jgi:hypothetical protein
MSCPGSGKKRAVVEIRDMPVLFFRIIPLRILVFDIPLTQSPNKPGDTQSDEDCQNFYGPGNILDGLSLRYGQTGDRIFNRKNHSDRGKQSNNVPCHLHI